jgi:hypothetical protein
VSSELLLRRGRKRVLERTQGLPGGCDDAIGCSRVFFGDTRLRAKDFGSTKAGMDVYLSDTKLDMGGGRKWFQNARLIFMYL